MKIIKRKKYLNQLIDVKGTPDVKVITGIRRSGKSKLLESFIKYITKNDINSNIIYINFNDDKFEKLLEYHALLQFIKSRFIQSKNNYLFIDEVQMCKGFEKALNSLHSSEKYDIYITGSNAFLLSSDLATLFTGRTFEIEVFPFSFEEFLQYYKYDDTKKAFFDYLKWGGMSGSYLYKSDNSRYKYLSNIFDTLILRDVTQKYKIRNSYLLHKITDYLIDNISNETSSRKIANYLSSNNLSLDHKTIGKYIEYLYRAFAFYRIRRYDIRGKKYLANKEKYYLCDHSFKYAKHGFKNADYGRTLENIVAIELLRRGYEVYTGVVNRGKEIDFIAIKNNDKQYIQVCLSLDNESTKQREITALKSIKDSYPKTIITVSNYPDYDIDGIKVINIENWLKK